MSGGGIIFDAFCWTQLTISPAAVSANTTAEQTFTLRGLRSTDQIICVQKPTTQAGLGIVGWRVSATDTIAITFINATSSSITPTATQAYNILAGRPEKVLGSADALSNIVIFN